MKYLDYIGLNKFWNKIKSLLNNKVDKIDGGTSTQFLKADGSIDDSEYLADKNWTGSVDVYTLSSGIYWNNSNSHDLNYPTDYGILINLNKHDTYCFRLYGTVNGQVYSQVTWSDNKEDWRQFAFIDSNVANASNLKGKSSNTIVITPEPMSINYRVNLDKSYDGMFYSSNNANAIISLNRYHQYDRYISQLGFNSDGSIFYRSFNEEYPNATLPWKTIAFTNSNIESANKLTAKILTNEDLNTIRDPGKFYYGSGGNTCANKPAGISWFSLQVYLAEGNFTIQIITGTSGTYNRRYTGSWQSWKKMLTEDDISDLITRIEALESKVNS